MARLWTFRCYVSPDGADEIRRWYEGQTKKVQAKFLSRIRALAQLPFNEWHGILYKTLHGECLGLGEIRFKADNIQQRPLGFRSGKSEFTILFCAIEKSDRFSPRNACETALDRKAEVVKSKERTNALWLALE